MSSEGPLLMLGSASQTVEAIHRFSSSASGKEKGCDGWTPTPRRGIRTVPIPESARTRQGLLDRQTPLTSWPPSSPEPPGNQQALFPLHPAGVRAEEPASSKGGRRLRGQLASG